MAHMDDELRRRLAGCGVAIQHILAIIRTRVRD